MTRPGLTEREVPNFENTGAGLHEADRRNTEFVSTLAHQLRTPLALIGNGLQVMRREAGYDRHLVKPVDAAALMQLLDANGGAAHAP